MKDIKKIKKYAEALYHVSLNNNQDFQLIINNLNSFKYSLKDIPELKCLILSKRVSSQNKHSIVSNVFKNYLTELELELLSILIDNGDAGLFSDIVDRFISIVDLNSNMKKIHITSSYEYSESDRMEMIESIKQKFNIDNVSETSFEIDESLLGGVKIRIGNRIIDGSVSTKLKKVKQSLLSV